MFFTEEFRGQVNSDLNTIEERLDKVLDQFLDMPGAKLEEEIQILNALFSRVEISINKYAKETKGSDDGNS